MYALTVLEPWADAIANGPKRFENRTWKPPQAAIGQLIAIHAGKRLSPDILADYVQIARRAGINPQSIVSGFYGLPAGAVVAVARLTGYATASDDPWFEGPIGWQLADVLSIVPVACRGMQGLWQLPPDVETRVLRAMGEAQFAREVKPW